MNIYDIAKLAGVSHTTVSRVINNKGNVKYETEQKIRRILEEQDYFPNSFARGLANNSNKIIGIIVIDIRNIHHTTTAFNIEEELSRHGYMCIVGSCGAEKNLQEEYMRLMAGRNLDGLVLIGSKFQNQTIKACIVKYFANKPVVMANGYLELKNVTGVMVKEKEAVCEVVRVLTQRHHTKIAFVNNDESPSALSKEQGFIKGIEETIDQTKELIIRHIETDIWQSFAETKKLLINEEVSAIIYSEDIMAVGGVKAALELKKKIPEQISIIGFNNSIYSLTSTPMISSIDNNVEQMGHICVEALLKMLNNQPCGNLLQIEPKFVEKETT